MARNVEDVALLLDAMAGEHPRDPLSLPRTGDLVPVGGALGTGGRSASHGRPISASPRSTAKSRRSPAKAAERFAELGATVEEAHPDLSETHDCFRRLRAYYFLCRAAKLLRNHRDLLKPEVIWNIEKGGKTTWTSSSARRRSACR